MFAFEGKVEAYFHICDNSNISANDKWVNIRPVFTPVNLKFIQFRVFKKHFNIEMPMVPYCGFNSCKMFIRWKPIHFS